MRELRVIAEEAAPPIGSEHREVAAGGPGHLPMLDGVRGIAILLVMMVHLTVMSTTTMVDRAFLYVAHAGWMGVDLFFVLSGFLITGILYDARNAPHYFRNFYARRTLRIFPLYYAVVSFALVIVPSVPLLHSSFASPQPLRNEWMHWFYLSNFAIAWEQN